METMSIESNVTEKSNLFDSIQNEDKQQDVEFPSFEADVQKFFLTTLQKQKSQISIFLCNGIRLKGYIGSFNDSVIILFGDTVQMIYKHAIATILLT